MLINVVFLHRAPMRVLSRVSSPARVLLTPALWLAPISEEMVIAKLEILEGF
jgi:hypothetical protein